MIRSRTVIVQVEQNLGAALIYLENHPLVLDAQIVKEKTTTAHGKTNRSATSDVLLAS